MALKNPYIIIETLHENTSVLVQRAQYTNDSKNVILKKFKPSKKAFKEFFNERKILTCLHLKHIPKLIDNISSADDNVNILEDIGGDSLFNILARGRLSFTVSLEIALHLAETIRLIHENDFLHTTISPHNIIYNIQTKALELVNFTKAQKLSNVSLSKTNDHLSLENMLYTAPELTGLTKQYKPDLRSDLFSLGMSLYHLFAGRSPFDASDRYELTHKLIAYTPRPLHELDSSIPPVLSRIIQKLIQKRPEARYQTDEALLYDLDKCIHNVDEKEQIPDFEIAAHDPKELKIGQDLFGRDKELALLKKKVEKNSGIDSCKVLVSGSSGVGKTRLIEEFFTFFDPDHTLILRTKFDQYQKPVPYASFKQLFMQIQTFFLSQRKPKNRTKISKNSAAVLSHVFPELSEMLEPDNGNLTPVLADMNVQLPLAVKEFFKSLAFEDASLLIFFDDLQWADPASVSLIKNSILDIHNPYLHFVGSFRNIEIKENEAAAKFINALEAFPDDILSIRLSPLKESDVKKMLKSLLADTTKSFPDFVSIVYRRTEGNPFFLKSFLQHLIDEKDLSLENGSWKYELEKIKTYSTTVDIAKIITTKFYRLNKREQSCLQYFALLGNHFEIAFSLEALSSFGYEKEHIYSIIDKGFIDQVMGKFQFAHAQIQSFVYASIDEATKRNIHLKIGKYLHSAYQNGDYADIITIVHHLNGAYTKERLPARLFRLNVQALEEIMKNNDPILALKQADWIKTNLYHERLWEKERSTVFRFAKLECRAFYLNAMHDKAFKQADKLLKRVKNINEKIASFSLLKDICVTSGKHFKQLQEFGDTIFNELGLSVPASKKALEKSLEKLDNAIHTNPYATSVRSIVNLPVLNTPKRQRIVSLLVDYWEASYYLSDIALMKWAYLTIIDISFKYGNSSASCFGYVLYGAQLASQKEFKRSAEFGKAALKLNHIFNDKKMLPKVHNFVANFINPYTKPLSTNVDLYQKSLYQSKINADIVFGTWANFLMHLSSFLSGTNLDELRENIARESHFINNSGDEKMIAIFDRLVDSLNTMQGTSPHNAEKETKALTLWKEENFYPALAWHGILKAQESLLNGNYEQGLSYLQSNVTTTANEVIMFPKIRLHFVRALLLLGKRSALSKEEEKLLAEDLQEYEAYSRASSATFKFERLLLKAETSKDNASYWNAGKDYDACLQQARHLKNDFYLSLASLSAGRFFEKIGFNDIADSYFYKASISLEQWGATALSKQIEESISTNKNSRKSTENNSLISAETDTLPANFQSLLKSFYAISQAQDNNELIHVLMRIILENATASKAVLILKKDKEFSVKADIDFTTGKIELYKKPLQETENLPQNVLSYAINTAKQLNLANPYKDVNFGLDPYFKKHRPASCLVLPTLLEGSVKALLYLENKELETPLSPQTVRTLELLLTQAAIVYKNTSLYETLKHNQDNLNKAQEIAHMGSWEFNNQTQKIIWSAETYRIYQLEPFSIEIDSEWFFSHLHPEDIDYINEAVEKALSGERHYDVTHRIITAKNEIKTVRQRAEAYYEGDKQMMAGTIQDITEQKRSEDRILRLSQLVEQTPFSTLITDTMGIIQYANAKTVQESGYSKEELIGHKMNIFRSKVHTKDFYQTMWKTIKEDKGIWRGTLINTMKDGSLRDCESTIFPLFDSNNDIQNFVTIQEDVTQRNIKEKLYLMQSRQAQMGEMLSMIAHQWRQPLSIIMALMNKERVKIILENSNTDDMLRAYDDIESQVLHLSQTISDFRDFFKPDKKTVRTTSSTLIKKSLLLLEHLLEKSNIRIITDFLTESTFVTYEREIEQVILNLINNAMDALKEHKIEEPVIRITSYEENDNAIITVEDNGNGIDPSILDSLFLPYISTKLQRHGTGLGLYMSKTIIEEHCHGSITAKNTDLGAKFTISIPIKDPNA